MLLLAALVVSVLCPCCVVLCHAVQSLHVGMKLLGCVLEVSDEQLTVSLPYGLRAVVPAAEVGGWWWGWGGWQGGCMCAGRGGDCVC
jgi:hypothetical protein